MTYPDKSTFNISDLDDESLIYIAYHFYNRFFSRTFINNLDVIKKEYEEMSTIHDIKKAYIEFYAAYVSYMIRTWGGIYEVFFALTQIIDKILSINSNYDNSELKKAISIKIESLYRSNIVYKRANEYLMNREIDIKKIICILHDKKWFITPSINIETVKRISENDSDIDNIIINYFLENDGQELRNMVERWIVIDSIKRREVIVKTCLNLAVNVKDNESHCYVIIPTIISQIDGLLQNLAEKLGLTSTGDGSWKDESGNKRNRERWIKDRTLETDFIDPIRPINEAIFELLFQKSYYGQPLAIPTTLSRHKIMHGEELQYGTIDNVIRVFLMMDFLSTVL